jgi:hypothetical protein
MTFGETKEVVKKQVEDLIPPEFKDSVKVEELFYDEPSYTGFVFEVDKYFPAWAYEENHPLVEAGQKARTLIGLPEAPSGKWNFSTNGVYWAGKAGIPSIGLAPATKKPPIPLKTASRWTIWSRRPNFMRFCLLSFRNGVGA